MDSVTKVRLAPYGHILRYRLYITIFSNHFSLKFDTKRSDRVSTANDLICGTKRFICCSVNDDMAFDWDHSLFLFDKEIVIFGI